MRISFRSIFHWLLQRANRKAELVRALVDSEARFRALFEQAGVGVVEIDGTTGRFIRANGRFCELVGYSEDELLAMAFGDVTHPDDLELNLSQVKAVVQGELSMFTVEKRFLRKDGAAVWAALTARPLHIPFETRQHLVSVIEDISARKQAEEQLRENRAYLDAALASMTDAVFISDMAGPVFQVN